MLDRCSQTFGAGERASQLGLGQNHRKFFSAQASDGILFANHRTHDLGQSLQYSIAGRMTAGVVDDLEVIDVEHQQRQRIAITPRARKLLQADFEELPAEIKSTLSEIDVTADMLVKGDRLMDLPLPDDELVVTVKRDDTFFIPNGRSKLYLNDKLMIISHSKKNPDTEVPDSNTPSEPAS